MSKILVAGSDLTQYFSYIDGDGKVTQQADGSIICSASENSRAYRGWKQMVCFGETYILKVRGCALDKTAYDDTSPRCNMIWYRQDGTMVRAVNGNFFSTEMTEETLVLTINQPVQTGDYIHIGFGSFASSKVDGLIQSASIYVENSSIPVKRTLLSGMIQLPPSAAGSFPAMYLHKGSPQIGIDTISFPDNNTIRISSKSLINIKDTRSDPVFNSQLLISLDAGNNYYQYQTIIGRHDRVKGSVDIVMVDRNKNQLVDFKTEVTKELFIQCNADIL